MAGKKNQQDKESLPFAPSVIDLFCGAGGISCGFRQAGFSVLAGIDNWEDALVTYRRNFSETKTLNADIEKIIPQAVDALLGDHAGNIDVIVGGPPCQGFSVFGFRQTASE
ncbi:MAG: hypothetical protein Ta2A_19330 [Treponemataceae bacterium]|nr:MAG: hypothetical protein Ta2A_19330 [Treponemataceae bacterium]